MLDLFLKAWESADVDGLVALLKEDATLSMPPSPSWYQGREAIRIFVAATVFADGGMFADRAMRRWRLAGTRANRSPAFVIFQRVQTDEYQPFGLHVIQAEGGRISNITTFINPSLPARFARLQQSK